MLVTLAARAGGITDNIISSLFLGLASNLVTDKTNSVGTNFAAFLVLTEISYTLPVLVYTLTEKDFALSSLPGPIQ